MSWLDDLDWSEAPLDHEGEAHVVDQGAHRDWTRCSCGGRYNVRQWPDTTGWRRGGPPIVPVYTEMKREHVAAALAQWLADSERSEAPRSEEQTSGVVGGAGIEDRGANRHTATREDS